ncbi:MAG: 2-C-methyl-D-erythritol 4-phosphate cytidylyltransferase [Gammaproteobacteria bacterium]|nr:MAG: 2-C-methyl-D-erythritol 4-phosphate cytidylyltransferase [Gammaproteobacteria bacterium]
MLSKQKINHAIWAIVPAAGIGKRMQSDIPKQYLPLNGRPVLEHTLNALLKNKNISGLVIALQQDDAYFSDIKINSDKPVLRAAGGVERADSVLNALTTLFQYDQFNADNDWVMVHDAVRACLKQQDIEALVSEVAEDKNGGLLALPVRDTMKRQNVDKAIACVAKTINRENLWHALTPQYFHAASLKKALEKAQLEGMSVTDESSAMEFAGFSPRLVQGHEDNIKITRPGDLRLASLYLQLQNSE